MSSNSTSSRTPPHARRAEDSAKIAWSPVATRVMRDRREINRAIARSNLPPVSKRMSKRPHTAPSFTNRFNTSPRNSGGSSVSACKSRITSPVAASMPARSCLPRPRELSMIRAPAIRASSTVRSLLPPSTTTISSAPRAERRVAPIIAASSTAGTTTDSFAVLPRSGFQLVFPAASIAAWINEITPRSDGGLRSPRSAAIVRGSLRI